MSCFNWSGLRGSNSLPGIPRMACGHSQEPYLTSDLNVLRTSGGGSEFSPSGKKTGHPNRMSGFNWSGLRGSNSLPPPWQGGALPDELSPRNRIYSSRTFALCQAFSFYFFNVFLQRLPASPPLLRCPFPETLQQSYPALLWSLPAAPAGPTGIPAGPHGPLQDNN